MLTLPKVTAVLLKYRRLVELEEIIDSLRGMPFIDEILVCDNTIENRMIYGRYLTALKAENEVIYFQDDDCLVQNITELHTVFVNSGGTKLVTAMKPERKAFYTGLDTLVGWGTFAQKRWLKCFDRYTARYGVDDMLLREADRVFTCLCPVGRVTVPAQVRDYPSAMSQDSLSLSSTHETSRQAAVARCKEILNVKP